MATTPLTLLYCPSRSPYNYLIPQSCLRNITAPESEQKNEGGKCLDCLLRDERSRLANLPLGQMEKVKAGKKKGTEDRRFVSAGSEDQDEGNDLAGPDGEDKDDGSKESEVKGQAIEPEDVEAATRTEEQPEIEVDAEMAEDSGAEDEGDLAANLEAGVDANDDMTGAEVEGQSAGAPEVEGEGEEAEGDDGYLVTASEVEEVVREQR